MSEAAKRAIDLGVAVAGIALLSPVILGLGIVIRLSSGPPVLFVQERVGRGGRHFSICKFRTMRVDHDGGTVSASGDARVTRIGRHLRKLKLDELPQLWNVIRGDMSLVGPRPEVPEYVARWPASDRDIILSVRPGITDPASLFLRNEGEMLARVSDPERYYVDVLLPYKCTIYRQYVESRSCSGDLGLVMKTAWTLMGLRRPV